MEELCKKNLNEPDYYDGVVSHPEPDILEWEVKWIIRSTAVNKAGGWDEIPAELFRSLKEDAIKVLHSLCHLEYLAVATGLERSILIPVPKKGSTKECANCWTVVLISHASKGMLKILHARLQLYVNQELPDVQAGYRKGRGTRDQIVNICWSIVRAREFQKKTSTSVSLTTLKLLCGSWQTVGSSWRDVNTRTSYLSPEKPVFRSRSNS